MAITDTKITDWLVAVGNNTPKDTDKIGSGDDGLGAQLRNIKGVVREDVDKGFTERPPSTYKVVNFSYAVNNQRRIYSDAAFTWFPVLSRNGQGTRVRGKYGQDFVLVIADGNAYKDFSSFTPFTVFTQLSYKDGSASGYLTASATNTHAAHRGIVLNSRVISSEDVGAVFKDRGIFLNQAAYTAEEIQDNFEGYTIVYAALPFVDLKIHPRVVSNSTYPKMTVAAKPYLDLPDDPYFPELQTLTELDNYLQLPDYSRTDGNDSNSIMAGEAATGSSNTRRWYPVTSVTDMVMEECVVKVVNSSNIENRFVTRNVYQVANNPQTGDADIESGDVRTKSRLLYFPRYPTGHNAYTSTLASAHYVSQPTSFICGNSDYQMSGSDPTYTLEETKLYWINSDNRPSSQFNDINDAPHNKYIIDQTGLSESRVEIDSCGGDAVSSPDRANSICGEGTIVGDGDSGPYYIDVYEGTTTWQTFYSYVQKQLSDNSYKVYEPKVHFQVLKTTATSQDSEYAGSSEQETTENFVNGHTPYVTPITKDDSGVPESENYFRGFRLKIYFGFAVPSGKEIKLAYMLLWPFSLDKNQDI